MEQLINKYKELREKIAAYNYALFLMFWDNETETPKNGLDFQSKNLAVLLNASYEISNSKERQDLIVELYNNKDALEPYLKKEIEQEYKELQETLLIPKNEYLDYRILTSKASSIWAEAKSTNNFELFRPTLEQIVAYNIKFLKYLETPSLKGYDILLNKYEEGMNEESYDNFFNLLKEKLVPFVLEKTSKKYPYNKKITSSSYPFTLQKDFSYYLASVIGYDLNCGVIKESVHPFTSGIASVDTRVTTRFLPNRVDSNIFSSMHEMGHAIFDQQINPSFDGTSLHNVTNMGLHESQSRLFENMIGRSFPFWETNYKALQDLFPKQLSKVSLNDFYNFINIPSRSLIRIEADELTYSLHIMVRYEIEKQLMNGKLKVKDLPKTWNKLYKQYLGIKPSNDSLGVLQDIHWSGGSFGYFPTYALGSAYSAQFYNSMDKDINVSLCIKNNDFKSIREWLKTNIHQYGAFKKPLDIIKDACNEEFNPNYYINYLIEKYK
ncbi:MAG: carboxypeptidase M32 [Acholeplasmatales bacterium]|jgi:carboxypeptidase Taq|nr:carboxypeptidase M32 [Acholeplasmatales bacterium]